MKPTTPFIRFSSLIFMSALAFSACDDGFSSSATPDIELTPESFVFAKLATGETAESSVQIENVGRGTLKLIEFDPKFSNDFMLFWSKSDSDAGGDRVAFANGENTFPTRIDIEPEEKLVLTLAYTANAESAPTGKLVFRTNDEYDPTITIPVRVQAASAEISVTPSNLDFGSVPAGDRVTRTLTVKNLGQIALTFQGIAIQGSEDFSIFHNSNYFRALSADFFRDPDGDGVEGLSPGKSFTLDISYASNQDGADHGELAFATNDPISPTTLVSLSANAAAPCISVPDSLEFGLTLLGNTAIRPFEIESCGGEPLHIDSIGLESSTASFALVNMPSLPADLPAYSDSDRANNNPPPTRTINVTFKPETEELYNANLIINSDDPRETPTSTQGIYRTTVPIHGQGGTQACPVAAVVTPSFDVKPLDIITLNGSSSGDPDNNIIRYSWIVTERPAGSTAHIVENFYNANAPADGGRPDDTSTPTAFFFVDLAGDYTINLYVTDSTDLTAPSDDCPQEAAQVKIRAYPDKVVHIQLVWDTPADVDQTDSDGTDVDLHLLHPMGTAFETSLDCYYNNRNPDWGPCPIPGLNPCGPDNNQQNNPSLDIDDKNGAGPENINLDAPEDTSSYPRTSPSYNKPYRIGVHYYSNEFQSGEGDYGPSTATVRVYLDGALSGEWSHLLQRAGNFWYVADLYWNSGQGRLTTQNRTYESIQNYQ